MRSEWSAVRSESSAVRSECSAVRSECSAGEEHCVYVVAVVRSVNAVAVLRTVNAVAMLRTVNAVAVLRTVGVVAVLGTAGVVAVLRTVNAVAVLRTQDAVAVLRTAGAVAVSRTVGTVVVSVPWRCTMTISENIFKLFFDASTENFIIRFFVINPVSSLISVALSPNFSLCVLSLTWFLVVPVAWSPTRLSINVQSTVRSNLCRARQVSLERDTSLLVLISPGIN